MHFVSHITMADPLPNLTFALPNSSLDVKLNMNLNPEATVHDDMYKVKYQHPDDLHEPVLCKPIRQM